MYLSVTYLVLRSEPGTLMGCDSDLVIDYQLLTLGGSLDLPTTSLPQHKLRQKVQSHGNLVLCLRKVLLLLQLYF